MQSCESHDVICDKSYVPNKIPHRKVSVRAEIVQFQKLTKDLMLRGLKLRRFSKIKETYTKDHLKIFGKIHP